MRENLNWTLCLVVMLALPIGAQEPVGHWPFDGHLDDVAGSANGTFFGGAPSYVKGKMKQAILFDGSDDYVEVMVGNLDAYTISAWVMPERTDAASLVVRTSASGTTTHWSHQVRIAASGVFEHYLWDGSARIVLGTTPIEAGNWYFVAISAANNGPVQLYVDGQEEGTADTVAAMWGAGDRYHIGSNSGNSMGWFEGIIDDVRIYGAVLSQEEIERVMKSNLQASSEPFPADAGADVPRDVVLGWSPGESAATHDVYLGTVFDDVNNASRADPMGVLLSQGQTATAYDPEGLLDLGQTYYWRVDEVNAAPDNTIFKGAVWSFTVEPFAYPIANVVATSNGISDAGAGPERTVDGSGLNTAGEHSTESTDMWLAVPGAEALGLQYEFDRLYKLHEMLVWNYNVQFELLLGFGVKDVTVDYSVDGANWTALGEAVLAQATARADYAANTAVAFNGVPAQYVRLTVNSGYGPMGQFGLSEVRFMFIPAHAREPEPSDGETDVLVGATLSWRAGREAVTHDVYLGTDAEALPLVDSVSEASYVPGGLEFGSTYYWRIDEVNEADEVRVWEGDLWSFTAQEFAVIDDMESYDDEENRIFDIWLDGFVNDTGSTVGYFEAPFAETTIVNS
ncbi:MAG: LamG domain-containing protein, partial [Planctomycetota bacterium]